MTSTPQQDLVEAIQWWETELRVARYRHSESEQRVLETSLSVLRSVLAGATTEAASPEELVKPLKATLDRTWSDETPEQVIAIAANGLHWRDHTIEVLKVKAASLRAQIMKLPRRIEPLGGQQTSYVQLDNVLALLDATTKSDIDPVGPIPVMPCPRCGKMFGNYILDSLGHLDVESFHRLAIQPTETREKCNGLSTL